jgi:hypothetical protein
VAALNCGSNTNVAGPTTQNGFKAIVEPESKACYSALNNVWSLNVSAGFNGFSSTHLSGPVTATFYWNLTWDSTVTLAACSGGPYGTSTLSLDEYIYDATTAAVVANHFTTLFSITQTTCGASTNIHQGTLTPRTISVAFTATNGDNYQFASSIYAYTLSDANAVTPPTTTGVDSILNDGTGYDGQMSALQVY